MAKETEQKKQDGTDEIEKTVDPYTGELKPVPEDADQFIEVVPEETDDRNGKNYLLNEETSMDTYAADADADAVAEQSAHYTDDEDIKADFEKRQELAVGGRDELLEDLDEHHSLSPEISGGDLDASWQTANVAGEETVGGSAPTPDQDVVDELGAAAGLIYEDDEPLNSDAKILDRDRNRWELNSASAEDEADINDDEDIEDEEDIEDLEELELEDDELDKEEEDEDDDLEDDDGEDDYIEAEIEEEEDRDV
jgi:AAA ATPase containing von Willebrand factor type A (vWA) domain